MARFLPEIKDSDWQNSYIVGLLVQTSNADTWQQLKGKVRKLIF